MQHQQSLTMTPSAPTQDSENDSSNGHTRGPSPIVGSPVEANDLAAIISRYVRRHLQPTQPEAFEAFVNNKKSSSGDHASSAPALSSSPLFPQDARSASDEARVVVSAVEEVEAQLLRCLLHVRLDPTHVPDRPELPGDACVCATMTTNNPTAAGAPAEPQESSLMASHLFVKAGMNLPESQAEDKLQHEEEEETRRPARNADDARRESSKRDPARSSGQSPLARRPPPATSTPSPAAPSSRSPSGTRAKELYYAYTHQNMPLPPSRQPPQRPQQQQQQPQSRSVPSVSDATKDERQQQDARPLHHHHNQRPRSSSARAGDNERRRRRRRTGSGEGAMAERATAHPENEAKAALAEVADAECVAAPIAPSAVFSPEEAGARAATATVTNGAEDLAKTDPETLSRARRGTVRPLCSSEVASSLQSWPSRIMQYALAKRLAYAALAEPAPERPIETDNIDRARAFCGSDEKVDGEHDKQTFTKKTGASDAPLGESGFGDNTSLRSLLHRLRAVLLHTTLSARESHQNPLRGQNGNNEDRKEEVSEAQRVLFPSFAQFYLANEGLSLSEIRAVDKYGEGASKKIEIGSTGSCDIVQSFLAQLTDAIVGAAVVPEDSAAESDGEEDGAAQKAELPLTGDLISDIEVLLKHTPTVLAPQPPSSLSASTTPRGQASPPPAPQSAQPVSGFHPEEGREDESTNSMKGRGPQRQSLVTKKYQSLLPIPLPTADGEADVHKEIESPQRPPSAHRIVKRALRHLLRLSPSRYEATLCTTPLVVGVLRRYGASSHNDSAGAGAEGAAQCGLRIRLLPAAEALKDVLEKHKEGAVTPGEKSSPSTTSSHDLLVSDSVPTAMFYNALMLEVTGDDVTYAALHNGDDDADAADSAAGDALPMEEEAAAKVVFHADVPEVHRRPRQHSAPPMPAAEAPSPPPPRLSRRQCLLWQQLLRLAQFVHVRGTPAQVETTARYVAIGIRHRRETRNRQQQRQLEGLEGDAEETNDPSLPSRMPTPSVAESALPISVPAFFFTLTETSSLRKVSNAEAKARRALLYEEAELVEGGVDHSTGEASEVGRQGASQTQQEPAKGTDAASPPAAAAAVAAAQPSSPPRHGIFSSGPGLGLRALLGWRSAAPPPPPPPPPSSSTAEARTEVKSASPQRHRRASSTPPSIPATAAAAVEIPAAANRVVSSAAVAASVEDLMLAWMHDTLIPIFYEITVTCSDEGDVEVKTPISATTTGTARRHRYRLRRQRALLGRVQVVTAAMVRGNGSPVDTVPEGNNNSAAPDAHAASATADQPNTAAPSKKSTDNNNYSAPVALAEAELISYLLLNQLFFNPAAAAAADPVTPQETAADEAVSAPQPPSRRAHSAPSAAQTRQGHGVAPQNPLDKTAHPRRAASAAPPRSRGAAHSPLRDATQQARRVSFLDDVEVQDLHLPGVVQTPESTVREQSEAALSSTPHRSREDAAAAAARAGSLSPSPKSILKSGRRYKAEKLVRSSAPSLSVTPFRSLVVWRWLAAETLPLSKTETADSDGADRATSELAGSHNSRSRCAVAVADLSPMLQLTSAAYLVETQALAVRVASDAATALLLAGMQAEQFACYAQLQRSQRRHSDQADAAPAEAAAKLAKERDQNTAADMDAETEQRKSNDTNNAQLAAPQVTPFQCNDILSIANALAVAVVRAAVAPVVYVTGVPRQLESVVRAVDVAELEEEEDSEADASRQDGVDVDDASNHEQQEGSAVRPATGANGGLSSSGAAISVLAPTLSSEVLQRFHVLATVCLFRVQREVLESVTRPLDLALRHLSWGVAQHRLDTLCAPLVEFWNAEGTLAVMAAAEACAPADVSVKTVAAVVAAQRRCAEVEQELWGRVNESLDLFDGCLLLPHLLTSAGAPQPVAVNLHAGQRRRSSGLASVDGEHPLLHPRHAPAFRFHGGAAPALHRYTTPPSPLHAELLKAMPSSSSAPAEPLAAASAATPDLPATDHGQDPQYTLSSPWWLQQQQQHVPPQPPTLPAQQRGGPAFVPLTLSLSYAHQKGSLATFTDFRDSNSSSQPSPRQPLQQMRSLPRWSFVDALNAFNPAVAAAASGTSGGGTFDTSYDLQSSRGADTRSLRLSAATGSLGGAASDFVAAVAAISPLRVRAPPAFFISDPHPSQRQSSPASNAAPNSSPQVTPLSSAIATTGASLSASQVGASEATGDTEQSAKEKAFSPREPSARKPTLAGVAEDDDDDDDVRDVAEGVLPAATCTTGSPLRSRLPTQWAQLHSYQDQHYHQPVLSLERYGASSQSSFLTFSSTSHTLQRLRAFKLEQSVGHVPSVVVTQNSQATAATEATTQATPVQTPEDSSPSLPSITSCLAAQLHSGDVVESALLLPFVRETKRTLVASLLHYWVLPRWGMLTDAAVAAAQHAEKLLDAQQQQQQKQQQPATLRRESIYVQTEASASSSSATAGSQLPPKGMPRSIEHTGVHDEDDEEPHDEDRVEPEALETNAEAASPSVADAAGGSPVENAETEADKAGCARSNNASPVATPSTAPLPPLPTRHGATPPGDAAEPVEVEMVSLQLCVRDLRGALRAIQHACRSLGSAAKQFELANVLDDVPCSLGSSEVQQGLVTHRIHDYPSDASEPHTHDGRDDTALSSPDTSPPPDDAFTPPPPAPPAAVASPSPQPHVPTAADAFLERSREERERILAQCARMSRILASADAGLHVVSNGEHSPLRFSAVQGVVQGGDRAEAAAATATAADEEEDEAVFHADPLQSDPEPFNSLSQGMQGPPCPSPSSDSPLKVRGPSAMPRRGSSPESAGPSQLFAPLREPIRRSSTAYTLTSVPAPLRPTDSNTLTSRVSSGSDRTSPLESGTLMIATTGSGEEAGAVPQRQQLKEAVVERLPFPTPAQADEDASMLPRVLPSSPSSPTQQVKLIDSADKHASSSSSSSSASAQSRSSTEAESRFTGSATTAHPQQLSTSERPEHGTSWLPRDANDVAEAEAAQNTSPATCEPAEAQTTPLFPRVHVPRSDAGQQTQAPPPPRERKDADTQTVHDELREGLALESTTTASQHQQQEQQPHTSSSNNNVSNFLSGGEGGSQRSIETAEVTSYKRSHSHRRRHARQEEKFTADGGTALEIVEEDANDYVGSVTNSSGEYTSSTLSPVSEHSSNRQSNAVASGRSSPMPSMPSLSSLAVPVGHVVESSYPHADANGIPDDTRNGGGATHTLDDVPRTAPASPPAAPAVARRISLPGHSPATPLQFRGSRLTEGEYAAAEKRARGDSDVDEEDGEEEKLAAVDDAPPHAVETTVIGHTEDTSEVIAENGEAVRTQASTSARRVLTTDAQRSSPSAAHFSSASTLVAATSPPSPWRENSSSTPARGGSAAAVTALADLQQRLCGSNSTVVELRQQLAAAGAEVRGRDRTVARLRAELAKTEAALAAATASQEAELERLQRLPVPPPLTPPRISAGVNTDVEAVPPTPTPVPPQVLLSPSLEAEELEEKEKLPRTTKDASTLTTDEMAVARVAASVQTEGRDPHAEGKDSDPAARRTPLEQTLAAAQKVQNGRIRELEADLRNAAFRVEQWKALLEAERHARAIQVDQLLQQLESEQRRLQRRQSSESRSRSRSLSPPGNDKLLLSGAGVVHEVRSPVSAATAQLLSSEVHHSAFSTSTTAVTTTTSVSKSAVEGVLSGESGNVEEEQRLKVALAQQAQELKEREDGLRERIHDVVARLHRTETQLEDQRQVAKREAAAAAEAATLQQRVAQLEGEVTLLRESNARLQAATDKAHEHQEEVEQNSTKSTNSTEMATDATEVERKDADAQTGAAEPHVSLRQHEQLQEELDAEKERHAEDNQRHADEVSGLHAALTQLQTASKESQAALVREQGAHERSRMALSAAQAAVAAAHVAHKAELSRFQHVTAVWWSARGALLAAWPQAQVELLESTYAEVLQQREDDFSVELASVNERATVHDAVLSIVRTALTTTQSEAEERRIDLERQVSAHAQDATSVKGQLAAATAAHGSELVHVAALQASSAAWWSAHEACISQWLEGKAALVGATYEDLLRESAEQHMAYVEHTCAAKAKQADVIHALHEGLTAAQREVKQQRDAQRVSEQTHRRTIADLEHANDALVAADETCRVQEAALRDCVHEWWSTRAHCVSEATEAKLNVFSAACEGIVREQRDALAQISATASACEAALVRAQGELADARRDAAEKADALRKEAEAHTRVSSALQATQEAAAVLQRSSTLQHAQFYASAAAWWASRETCVSAWAETAMQVFHAAYTQQQRSYQTALLASVEAIGHAVREKERAEREATAAAESRKQQSVLLSSSEAVKPTSTTPEKKAKRSHKRNSETTARSPSKPHPPADVVLLSHEDPLGLRYELQRKTRRIQSLEEQVRQLETAHVADQQALLTLQGLLPHHRLRGDGQREGSLGGRPSWSTPLSAATAAAAPPQRRAGGGGEAWPPPPLSSAASTPSRSESNPPSAVKGRRLTPDEYQQRFAGI